MEPKTPILRTLLWLTLAAPGCAAAQAVAAPDPAQSPFENLWTGWSGANRESIRAEAEARERLERRIASADSDRLRQLGSEGRALGERVGEIVRLGDCEEGERLAREAGDFALVDAVRNHCRRSNTASASVPVPQR